MMPKQKVKLIGDVLGEYLDEAVESTGKLQRKQ